MKYRIKLRFMEECFKDIDIEALEEREAIRTVIENAHTYKMPRKTWKYEIVHCHELTEESIK